MSDREETIALARAVMRGARRAALGTVTEAGAPFVSLTTPAYRVDGTPLLLLSDLAAHTKNIRRDPHVSLLMEEATIDAAADPMTAARLTLSGRATISEAADDRSRFLARHPAAELYASLPDFRIYEVHIEDVAIVAGFGRARTLPPRDLLHRECELAEGARDLAVIDHMNEDHADAIEDYAVGLFDQPAGAWRMTGIDPDGADLRLDERFVRLPFPEIAPTTGEVRKILIRLLQMAREKG